MDSLAANKFMQFDKNQNDSLRINSNSFNGNKKLCATFKVIKNNQEAGYLELLEEGSGNKPSILIFKKLLLIAEGRI